MRRCIDFCVPPTAVWTLTAVLRTIFLASTAICSASSLNIASGRWGTFMSVSSVAAYAACSLIEGMDEKVIVLENLEIGNSDPDRTVCERNGEGGVENVDTSRSARVRTCPRHATPI